jgi:solute:Na+ symporter, SSS family
VCRVVLFPVDKYRGSGAVLIGGLYWKKGTTKAAWAAMIMGAGITLTAFILRIIWPIYYETDFPINSQWIYALTMSCSTGIYILISFYEKKFFNMDKILHRGMYSLESSHNEDRKTSDSSRLNNTIIKTIFHKLGLSKTFSRGDKIIFYSITIWSLGWFATFCIVTLCYFLNLLPEGFWIKFWITKVMLFLILGFVCTIWIAIGGIKDLRYMFKALRTIDRDQQDDGMVE